MAVKARLLRQLMVVWRKEWKREIDEMMTLSLTAACCERDGRGRLGSCSESFLLVTDETPSRTSTDLSGASTGASLEHVKVKFPENVQDQMENMQMTHILVWLLSDGTDTSFIWLLLTPFSLSLFISFILVLFFALPLGLNEPIVLVFKAVICG